jgi:glyoxylase-like metal-dependent hydrolase (beta-lactamase superfamily II)
VNEALDHPFAAAPPTGQVTRVADGILWARVALPFRLNHVNIYFIEDDGGWAVLDTGIDNAQTRAAWEALVAGPLKGQRLTRLIVSHFHPDHIGLAGWLCERFEMPLVTTQTTYLNCMNISLSPSNLDQEPYRSFYLDNGLPLEATQKVSTSGHSYLKMVSTLPPVFRRIVAGDTLRIGGRDFSVLTGDGHAPEQAMLNDSKARVFLAADQVLAKISPNVSVWAVDPEGDPLGLYVRSLRTLQSTLPEDTFVLPGHQLPFRGLHIRSRELLQHHEHRCALIADACRTRPHSTAELLPVLFPQVLDPHQMSFAFSEVLAHVNYMIGLGELAWTDRTDRIHRVRAV